MLKAGWDKLQSAAKTQWSGEWWKVKKTKVFTMHNCLPQVETDLCEQVFYNKFQ